MENDPWNLIKTLQGHQLNGTATLSDNRNHSNANHSPQQQQQKDMKIQTLKRKQRALKAELEETLCKTVNFQEAFQEEMELRSQLDEKYESLRIRYEVSTVVVGNGHQYNKIVFTHLNVFVSLVTNTMSLL